MVKYVFHRLLVALAVLFTVAAVSFSLLHLSGDLATAIAGPDATPKPSPRSGCKTGWINRC